MKQSKRHVIDDSWPVMENRDQAIAQLEARLTRIEREIGEEFAAIWETVQQLKGSAPVTDTKSPAPAPAAQTAPEPIVRNEPTREQTANLARAQIPPQGEQAPTPDPVPPTPASAAASAKRQSVSGSTRARQSQSAQAPRPPTPPRPPRTEPSVVEQFFKSLFGPIGTAVEQALGAYQHYQKQGRGPTFLLTLAGIVAMTAGIGYLLQYSFVEWLTPVGKIGAGVIIAAGICVVGIVMHGRSPTMRDYASGLIGLSTIVLYLCAYFAGPYFGLVGNLGSLVAFALTVWIGTALAATFETRVVAVLTLIGGVLAPLLLTNLAEISGAFVGFLLILTATSLYLARRTRWQALVFLTFMATGGALEYLALNGAQQSPALAIVAHGHFYLFLHIFLFDGLAVRSSPQKSALGLLAASTGLFILLIVQSIPADSTVGIVLAVNALLVAAPFAMRLTRGTKTGVLFVMIAGALLGYGALSLAGVAYAGVLWGLEAVALIVLGGRFDSRPLRFEGVLLLLLSSASTLWHAALWLLEPTTAWTPTVLPLIALAIYVELAIRAYGRSKYFKGERGLYTLLTEFLAIPLLLAWLISARLWFPQLESIFAFVPLFGLLLLASRRRLVLTQLLGLGHYALFVLAIIESAQVVNSFRFTQQPLLTQIAWAEAFAMLWLIQGFYSRFYPTSQLASIGPPLRQLFYLLVPIVWLPSAYRRIPEWFPMLCWLSCLLNWGLWRAVGSKPVKIELNLLLPASALVALAATSADLVFGDMNGTAALIAGGVVFFAFIRIEYGYDFDFLHRLAFYFWGAMATVLTFSWTLSAVAAFGVLALYSGGLVLMRPTFNALRKRLSLCLAWMIFATWGVMAAAWTTGANPLFAATAVIATLALWSLVLRANVSGARLARRRLGGFMFQHWVLNITIVCGYGAIIDAIPGTQADGPVMSIAMVIHATVLLFMTLRPRYAGLVRLSTAVFVVAGAKIVFVDMAEANMVGKIAALIVIGALLLGAAYKFQRVRDRAADVDAVGAGTTG